MVGEEDSAPAPVGCNSSGGTGDRNGCASGDRSSTAPAARKENGLVGNQGELHFSSARDPLATDKMAAAPPEVTPVRAVLELDWSARAFWFDRGDRVTSVLPADILEAGRPFLR